MAVRRRGRLRAVVPVLWLLAGGGAWAQAPSAEQLETLVTAQQQALDANDTAQILATGKQLGSFSFALLGTLYAGTERCKQASVAFDHAMTVDDPAVDPQHSVQLALQLLGQALCAGNREQAAHAREQVLKIAGDTGAAHLLLANTYHAANDLPKTIADLNRAVALEPDNAAVHSALGSAYWELNEYQYNLDTLREFEAAWKLKSREFSTNEDLGSILSQYERYREAAERLRDAIAAEGQVPDPWLQLGMNAFAQDELAEARTDLERAVALTTDEARNGYQVRRAYAALSRVAMRNGDTASAARFADREAALHRKMAESGGSEPLSESAGTSAQRRAASPAAGKGVEAAPSQQQLDLERHLKEIAAKSLNDAGTVLARERDYAGALPLFRMAAEADPELPPVLRNLGLAAFHTAAYAEAAKALAQALVKAPDDSVVLADLEQSRALLKQEQGH